MGQLNRCIGVNLRDIGVVLNYGPLGIVRAVTEHISLNRIQLNTGTINLQHNAEVEIVMSIPGVEYSEHHRINAQVLHCDEGGRATLGFHSCGEATMMALLPYLNLTQH